MRDVCAIAGVVPALAALPCLEAQQAHNVSPNGSATLERTHQTGQLLSPNDTVLPQDPETSRSSGAAKCTERAARSQWAHQCAPFSGRHGRPELNWFQLRYGPGNAHIPDRGVFVKTFSLLLVLTLLAFGSGAALAQDSFTVVNGASYEAEPLAPGSFASIFGQDLASGVFVGEFGSDGSLPLALGGVSVTVNGEVAMLSYVSPEQINFVVPSRAALGQANVEVRNNKSAQRGKMQIDSAGPGVFMINNMGQWEGAFLHGWLWRTGPFSVTTSGEPTQVSIFLTGLDLSTKPIVLVGGVQVEVTWYGSAPGYPGLQQINIKLPADFDGVGRVPVVIETNGKISNVTYIRILPTTELMTKRVPGWIGKILENVKPGLELSAMALNTANNTALVTDAEADVVRVISLDSKSQTASISLPTDSEAMEIAANPGASMAAAALTGKNSVAIINLLQNKVTSVISVGTLPGGMAFAGQNLLVANAGSNSVSVINTLTNQVIATIAVGHGPTSIAVAGTTALVTNLQSGSVSIIDLTTNKVTEVALENGTRPREVAITADGLKAVITSPPSNAFFIMDVPSRTFKKVATSSLSGLGPSAVAINGMTAFVASQMSANIHVVDLTTGNVTKTFSVDPGPRELAVNPSKNQLVVLAMGTATIDVVDLSSFTVIARINSGVEEHQATWPLPIVATMTPNTGKIGTTFTLTLTGLNLNGVIDLNFDFHMPRMMNQEDNNIKVTNVKATADGKQVTATVQITAAATEGTRLVRLVTDKGEVRPPFTTMGFTVTK